MESQFSFLWRHIQLQLCLLDNGNANDIMQICEGRTLPESLRLNAWQVCLDVRQTCNTTDPPCFLYDEQNENYQRLQQPIRNAIKCRNINSLDARELCEDVTQVILHYCKQHNVKYDTHNGWIDMVLALLAVNAQRFEAYHMFEAIMKAYIPKRYEPNDAIWYVFDLLLCYHDAALHKLLKQLELQPYDYARQWFQSLFAQQCNDQVLQAIWDSYFQRADPFLVFFQSLVVLLNSHGEITRYSRRPKEEILTMIKNLPSQISSYDVSEFCSLANYYSSRTPNVFKTVYLRGIFGIAFDATQPARLPLMDRWCIGAQQELCMPTSIEDLLKHYPMRYLTVDCRPKSQYDAGHLPWSYNLDREKMVKDTETSLRLLFRQQASLQRTAICFIGSGEAGQDNLINILIPCLVRHNINCISILLGGYRALHDYFSDDLAANLTAHNTNKCKLCVQAMQLNLGGAAGDETAGSNAAQVFNAKQNKPIHRRAKLNPAINKDKSLQSLTSNANGAYQYDINDLDTQEKQQEFINRLDCFPQIKNWLAQKPYPLMRYKNYKKMALRTVTDVSGNAVKGSKRNRPGLHKMGQKYRSKSTINEQRGHGQTGAEQAAKHHSWGDKATETDTSTDSAATKHSELLKDIKTFFNLTGLYERCLQLKNKPSERDIKNDAELADLCIRDVSDLLWKGVTLGLKPLLEHKLTMRHFQCTHLRKSGKVYNAELLLTAEKFIVLHELSLRDVEIVAFHSLRSIRSITVKENNSDIVGFHYDNSKKVDYFYIPNASAVVEIIYNFSPILQRFLNANKTPITLNAQMPKRQ